MQKYVTLLSTEDPFSARAKVMSVNYTVKLSEPALLNETTEQNWARNLSLTMAFGTGQIIFAHILFFFLILFVSPLLLRDPLMRDNLFIFRSCFKQYKPSIF